MFTSLKFGSRRVTPDDVIPQICCDRLPQLCTGVLLFDILVANADRHQGNIKVDDPHNPTQIEVFDHDRAMFGATPDQGTSRLNQLWDRLGVSGGSQTGENPHCFLDALKTASHMNFWIDRIGTLPDTFLENVCDEVRGLPVNQDEVNLAWQFLRDRRDSLGKLIRDNRDEFTEVTDWGLLP